LPGERGVHPGCRGQPAGGECARVEVEGVGTEERVTTGRVPVDHEAVEAGEIVGVGEALPVEVVVFLLFEWDTRVHAGVDEIGRADRGVVGKGLAGDPITDLFELLGGGEGERRNAERGEGLIAAVTEPEGPSHGIGTSGEGFEEEDLMVTAEEEPGLVIDEGTLAEARHDVGRLGAAVHVVTEEDDVVRARRSFTDSVEVGEDLDEAVEAAVNVSDGRDNWVHHDHEVYSDEVELC